MQLKYFLCEILVDLELIDVHFWKLWYNQVIEDASSKYTCTTPSLFIE
jgi:hypothetical protein